MSGLSYGLNLSKKPGASKPAPARRKPIFGEDDSDPDDSSAPKAQVVEGIGGFEDEDVAVEKPKAQPGNVAAGRGGKDGKANGRPTVSIYGDLSSSHASNKHAAEATSLDPSIYDYDAAYDSLHAASSKKAQSVEDAERRPKYMASLLAASEVRKRDQLRAKDKLLAKEREAEGDEYADKEKFVTSAYKAQQEEVRRLEEEERIREAEERRLNRGKGMTGFYRSVLDKDEKRHEEAVGAAAAAAAAAAKGDEPAMEPEEEQEKSEAEIAKELRAQGREVDFNDEGQVVDKRQLLSAGLNVVSKPKAAVGGSTGSSALASRAAAQPALQDKAGAQRSMRERQTRMMEEQLAQATKRAAEDEDEKQNELERAAKSKKTKGDISSARERYLQRKREAEEAKKGG